MKQHSEKAYIIKSELGEVRLKEMTIKVPEELCGTLKILEEYEADECTPEWYTETLLDEVYTLAARLKELQEEQKNKAKGETK